MDKKISINLAPNIIINNGVLIIILFLGILVRLWSYPNVPPGLNQDEASSAYEAYSLLKTCRDREGLFLPVHFKSWGSGQNVLYSYLSIPFIKLFGLNVFSARIVNLLFGVLALFIFYFLIKKAVNPKVALISVFLLSMSPWHIMMSRWGLESNLLPPIFLLAVYFLVLGFKQKKLLFLAFLFFALSLYSYTPAILCVFLFLTSIFFFYFNEISRNRLCWIFASILFFLFAFPLGLFIFKNNFGINIDKISRFIPLGIPTLTSPRSSMLMLLGKNYFSYSTLREILNNLMVLLLQRDGLPWNAIPKWGVIYHLSTPFFLYGFYLNVIRFRRNELGNIFLLWFLAAFSLFFIFSININRTNLIYLPMIFFTACGIHELISRLKFKKIVSCVLFGAYLGLFTSFVHFYFTSYVIMMHDIFEADFKPAAEFITENISKDIYITSSINQPYILLLFYSKYDPHRFQKIKKYYYDERAAFRAMKRFDRFRFCDLRSTPLKKRRLYLLRDSEMVYLYNRHLLVKDFKKFKLVITK